MISIDSARTLVKDIIGVQNGTKYEHIIDQLDFRPKDFTSGYETYPGLHGKYCFYHSEGYIILTIHTIEKTMDINTQLINSLYYKDKGYDGLYPPHDEIPYDKRIMIRDYKLDFLLDSLL